jgi:methionyl-tRNA formyltransferase
VRIVLIGQAAFGQKVLERLIERKENVVGVFCPPDAPGRPDPLKELAQKEKIPVFQPKRWKEAREIAEFKSLNPDLNVLAFVTDIIPREILEYPTHGSIQYHPSLLPKHRGKSAINWAVIKGEEKTGLSIFWVDEGIDTGPILLQREVEIASDDTTGSLYFDKLFPMGVDALVEALDMVKAGTAPKMVQDASQATYEPPCEERHAQIDWDRPIQEVHNLIRGCDPQPAAHTLCRGKRLQIYASKALCGYEPPGKSQPGEILNIGEDGILVMGNGGALLIQKVRPAGGGKIASAEFARETGLRKGDRME